MSDAIRLGQAAQRLLDDDMVKDVFAHLKEKYKSDWEQATGADAREALWNRIAGLNDVQQELRRLRDSGIRAERTTA